MLPQGSEALPLSGWATFYQIIGSAAAALTGPQFAHEQRDAIALVASQDGQFTVFAWSSMHDIVHAYRLESLLI